MYVCAFFFIVTSNPDTGKTALKRVVRTFRNESEELVHLTVSGEEITTTPGHPFWVPQKGWTKAVHLRAGDRLHLLNGEYVVVEQVQHELLEDPVFVYKFEVEDFHTYYVGTDLVLVHNRCQAKSYKKINSKANYILSLINTPDDYAAGLIIRQKMIRMAPEIMKPLPFNYCRGLLLIETIPEFYAYKDSVSINKLLFLSTISENELKEIISNSPYKLCVTFMEKYSKQTTVSSIRSLSKSFLKKIQRFRSHIIW